MVEAVFAVTWATTTGGITWTLIALSEPSLPFVPLTTTVEPTVTSLFVPLAVPSRKAVDPVTVTFCVVPSRRLTVNPSPEVSVTVPATLGRITSSEVTVYVPSLALVWPMRTWSPVLRSDSVAEAPPRVILTASVTATVRVQPSAVVRVTFEPAIELIVIGPTTEPPRGPPPAGPPPKPNGPRKAGPGPPDPKSNPKPPGNGKVFAPPPVGAGAPDADGDGDAARATDTAKTANRTAPIATPIRSRSPRPIVDAKRTAGSIGSVGWVGSIRDLRARQAVHRLPDLRACRSILRRS